MTKVVNNIIITLEMAHRRVKWIEIWDSGTLTKHAWDILDLELFMFIMELFGIHLYLENVKFQNASHTVMNLLQTSYYGRLLMLVPIKLAVDLGGFLFSVFTGMFFFPGTSNLSLHHMEKHKVSVIWKMSQNRVKWAEFRTLGYYSY